MNSEEKGLAGEMERVVAWFKTLDDMAMIPANFDAIYKARLELGRGITSLQAGVTAFVDAEREWVRQFDEEHPEIALTPEEEAVVASTRKIIDLEILRSKLRECAAALSAAEERGKSWKVEATAWEAEVVEFGYPISPEHDHHEVRDWLNDAFAAGEERGKKAGLEEERRLKAVIHHVTLEVEFFGRHDPSCCAAGKPATAPECECGLRETLAFGVEQSGMPLESPPMTPDEEARFHEAGMEAVERALAQHRALALTPTAQEKGSFISNEPAEILNDEPRAQEKEQER